MIKHILPALFLLLLMAPLTVCAQSSVNMVNNDTVVIDACLLSGGTIYDDGGAEGNYSNSFDGTVHIIGTPGLTINLTGSYTTESNYDFLTISDGETILLNNASGTSSVNLSSNTGELYIHFHTDQSATRVGFELQWSVDGTGTTCLNPVSGLDTTQMTDSTIGLIWSAPNPSGPFVLSVDFAGGMPAYRIEGITDTTFLLTGINPATTYSITVVDSASASNRCCAGQLQVRTACGSVMPPFREGFEGMDEGSFPDCWLQQVNFDDEDYMPQVVMTHHNSGNRSLMLSCGGNNTAGHFGMVATPPFATVGSHTTHISLMASHYGTQVTVGVCDSGGSEYNSYGFTPITTLSLTAAWVTYRVDWTVAVPGQRLALRMVQSQQGNTGCIVYIDDFGFESCGVDSLTAYRNDHSSATLSWTTFGTPICTLKVRAAGADADTLVFDSVASPYEVTGLEGGHTYTFTLQPTCDGHFATPASVTVTMPSEPTVAENYCSNFRSGSLPTNWTFHTQGNATFSSSTDGITFSVNYSYSSTGYMVSEHLMSLAGKTVVIEYSTTWEGGYIEVGTLTSADDTNSFTPIASPTYIYTGYYRQTLTLPIPANASGNHLAIKLYNGSYYFTCTVHSLQITDADCYLGHIQLLHRRGTTAQFSWGEVVDTVLVMSGLHGFDVGDGTARIDTFYNASRGTVHGLTPNTQYDFHFYRPCSEPCSGRFLTILTATQDYPLHYCEDFEALTASAWNSGSGDWLSIYSVNSTPQFSWTYILGGSNQALDLASWGSGYNSMACLPDVEVDSSTLLSFYISGTAPSSSVVVGTIPEGYSSSYFDRLDTIHIPDGITRSHHWLRLRPSDTLFDARLTLMLVHSDDYAFYREYIDELQLARSAYGNLSVLYVGYDSASFSIDTLLGTDSVEVTLESGSHLLTLSLAATDIAAFGIGGLLSGCPYRVYVHPHDGGCRSLATVIVTQPEQDTGNMAYGSCFTMDRLLSYELPRNWSASGSHEVTPDDHLQLPPATALAMHPISIPAGRKLLFKAKSTLPVDTLVVGYIAPADTIDTNSTSFTFDPTLFTTIDRLAVDTAWKPFTIALPATSSNCRIAFLSGNGHLELDNIGVSSCPLVHYTVDGNVIVCSVDPGQNPYYTITLHDSSGIYSRTIAVEEDNQRILGLQYNTKYIIEATCSSDGGSCNQVDEVRTVCRTPLPYCEFFNQSYSTIALPTSWTIIKGAPQDTVYPTSNELCFQPYNGYSSTGHYMYAVLPPFEVDSALLLYVNGYCNYSAIDTAVQLGVMDNDLSVSSFVPLWSRDGTTYSIDAQLDLGAYTDKRVAIRFNSRTSLYSVRAYSVPTVHYELPRARTLRAVASSEHPYWLHLRYSSYVDSLYYIDTSTAEVYFNHYHAYVSQGNDSTGYTCEGEQSYYLGYLVGVPFCYRQDQNSGTGNGLSFTYGSTEVVSEADKRHLRLHDGAWVVLHDMDIDAVQRLGLALTYRADSPADRLVVGVMTDAYDTLTFSAVDTLSHTLDENWLQKAYVDFAPYAGSGHWIALHHLAANPDHSFYINEVFIDSCLGAVGATVGLKRWNQVRIDAPAVPFYAEYHPTGNPSSATVLRVDNVPMLLTLAPETQYDFSFTCDSGATSCRQVQQVKTLAAPLALPGCVDFDTLALDTIPRGWQRMEPGIAVSDSVAHSAPHSLRMPIGATTFVTTPDVDIDSMQRLTMSLWYRTDDPSDRLVVGVMKSPGDLASWHPIRTLASDHPGTWQRGLVEFSSAPDGSSFIALRARSNRQPEGRSLFVDDIYLDTCIAFGLRVKDIASDHITLDWNHRGAADVTVTVRDGDTVLRQYTHAMPPFTIDSLTTLHYYTFLFDSRCSDDSGHCNTNLLDSLSVVIPAEGIGCIDATDLNSEQAVYYSGTFYNPYASSGAVDHGAQNPDTRHTVCYDTAERDPRTGGLLRTIPQGHTSSVRLGNWGTNALHPEAEGVIYSLFVDTSSFELLLLRYAAVLQNPMHAAEDQPRFRMELLDTNFNIIDSACTSADFIADQSLGWNSAEGGVLWKDWTAVGVDLSGHAGQQLYLRLTTFDCNEGSHYGYAYFTLECMDKNKQTETCGDVDSNTLSAPEGFNYRWYTSLSPATVSTAQSITVPSEDITYHCEVSKIGNAGCSFTISAYGGTRYPMASFDTAIRVEDCRFHVRFLNRSAISSDGVTPMPGTACETAYWDFGNGHTGTSLDGDSTVYPLPGTYTVMLVSGIADNHCLDTFYMTLVLSIPDESLPSDTLHAVICDNQTYTFHGSVYDTAGLYRHHTPNYQQPDSAIRVCDSLHVLHLDLHFSNGSDTTAIACDSIRFHGALFTSDTLYTTPPVGLNVQGCDSTVTLHLTVMPVYEVNDTHIICPWRQFLYEGIDFGGPTVFDAPHLSVDGCDSLVHVVLMARDSTYRPLVIYSTRDSAWLDADTIILGCAPDTLHLRDTSGASVAWLWTYADNDTTIIDTTNEMVLSLQDANFMLPAPNFYTLIVEDTLGCLDTISHPIYLFHRPHADFGWSPGVPAIDKPEAQFTNQSDPLTNELWPGTVIRYLWNIQPEPGADFDTTTVINPFYQWGTGDDNREGDYAVQLIAYWTQTAADTAVHHTCTDTANNVVTITNDYLQFPNLVTPNGDGINDTWRIVNLLEYGNYPINELWIYDQWGVLVYHVRNISTEGDFWNPNATASPDGTYFFRFSARSIYGLAKRNGIIEVLRD